MSRVQFLLLCHGQVTISVKVTRAVESDAAGVFSTDSVASSLRIFVLIPIHVYAYVHASMHMV